MLNLNLTDAEKAKLVSTIDDVVKGLLEVNDDEYKIIKANIIAAIKEKLK